MSFSFYIPAPEPPDYQMLLDGLDFWDVHCEEGEAEDAPREGSWPEGALHFYRDEVSTRGVEVNYENRRFQVRILSLASPEDYELALRFVESAAVLLKQPIEPEDDEPFPVEQLRERYDDEWVRDMNDSGARAVRYLINDGDQTVTSWGPHRAFHIGPRLLKELDEAGPESEFSDRLLEKMKQVQNIDPDEYYCANTMEAKRDENDPDEKGFTFAVWGPGVFYLLPDVKYLALVRGEEEPPIFIPKDKFAEVLPDGWEWADEKQVLVQAIDEDEWAALVERAREYEVSPFEA
jgi:hypothetical protein